MNANVHTSVGLATATGVAILVPAMQCKSVVEYGLCLGCAVVGALLPDIDANGESKAKKEFRQMMTYLSVFVICVLGLSYLNGTLLSTVLEFSSSMRGIGSILFLIFCVVGYLSGHRQFTHYAVGLICFTVSFMMFAGVKLGLWFGVGFLSHQLIDMLNKKKIKWLYPLPFDFSRYICYASSKTSNMIGGIAFGLFISFALKLVVFK